MNSMSISRISLTLWAFGGAVACREAGISAPPPCTGALALAVGRGLQPTIDWQPGCAVTTVSVIPAHNGAAFPLWAVSAYAIGVTPPLSVGTSPPGTSVWGQGSSLVADSVYRLYVARGLRGSTSKVDSLIFTAKP